MRISTTLIAVFLLLASSARSQMFEELPEKKYLQDLESFVEYLSIHPEPYLYHSQSDFESQISEAKSKINSGINNIEFYQELNKITALIKDGHTKVYPSASWVEKEQKESGVFPLDVYLSNENILYIKESYVDTYQDIVGSEILAINGLLISDIITKLDPLVAYERLPFRNVVIESNFRIYLYCLFGQVNNLELTCRKSKERTVNVDYMDYREYKKLKKDTREQEEKLIATGKPYDYESLGSGLGMISIYAFSARDNHAYETFLIETFKKVKKDSVQHLIIDLRKNFGGWPKMASQLMHYISEKHFKYMAVSEALISEHYKEHWQSILAKYGISSVSPFNDLYSLDIRSIVTEPTGTIIKEDVLYNETPATKQYEFNGTTYLLIDRYSYSAASTFAAGFKCGMMGYIIGEETGGTNIFYANAINKILLNTKTYLSISTTKKYTPCFDTENPHAGITPQFNVSPSVLDIVNDFDSQLNYTKRVIRKIEIERAKAMEGGG